MYLSFFWTDLLGEVVLYFSFLSGLYQSILFSLFCCPFISMGGESLVKKIQRWWLNYCRGLINKWNIEFHNRGCVNWCSYGARRHRTNKKVVDKSKYVTIKNRLLKNELSDKMIQVYFNEEKEWKNMKVKGEVMYGICICKMIGDGVYWMILLGEKKVRWRKAKYR